MSRATTSATPRSMQPSRDPARKRERRIIRRFLKAATFLNAAKDLAPDEVGNWSVELDAANVALASLTGYAVEEND
jgi:hypothetical protein